MAEKVVVKNLYKVYGQNPALAMQMLNKGQSKEEIFKQTGMTIGVKDANFHVNEGEIFVLMGLSGSGKSTLIRLLNRLVEPTHGQILVGGNDVAAMSKKALIELRRKDLAMVFQSFALLPHLSVLRNTAFGLEVAGVERKAREIRALEVLDQVGLKAFANQMPSELSGGMQQRVGLARAIYGKPSFVVLDEPNSSLDEQGDAALGRQAVMVAADREDVPVGFEVLGVDHLARLGALGPETRRDILLLRSRGVRTLAEDSHGECLKISL